MCPHLNRRTAMLGAVCAMIAIVVAMAVTLVVSVPQAAADTGWHCAWKNRGCARFQSDGDKFQICDNLKGDGYGVAVVYEDRRHAGLEYAVQSGSGCRWNTESHKEGTVFAFTVCLAKYTRPGGRRMKVNWPSCSGNVRDTF
jgi:hypothetical protein